MPNSSFRSLSFLDSRTALEYDHGMKLKTGLQVTAVVIGLGGVILLLNLSRIIRSGIEFFGSQVLGVEVTVGSVILSPLGGSCRLGNLRVANPPGYRDKYLMELGSVSATMGWKDLAQDPIRIESIVIRDLKVNWEGTLSSSNATKIQNNIARYSPAETSKKTTKKEKGLLIAKLKIEKSMANARLGQGSDAVPVELPDMELTDVGSHNKAATIQQVASVVVGRIVKAVAHEIVTKQIGQKTGETLQRAGSEVVGGIKKLFGK